MEPMPICSSPPIPSGPISWPRRTRLHNSRTCWAIDLVIVVPADSKIEVKKPEDLLASGIAHLALGEPKSVPAGIYAKQALTKLGIWEQLQAKVVSAEMYVMPSSMSIAR